jgi:hypothetical protein
MSPQSDAANFEVFVIKFILLVYLKYFNQLSIEEECDKGDESCYYTEGVIQ